MNRLTRLNIKWQIVPNRFKDKEKDMDKEWPRLVWALRLNYI